MFSRKKYWVDWIIKFIMIALLLLLIGQVKAQQSNAVANDPLFFLYTKNTIIAYELNFDNEEKLNKGNPLKVSMQNLLGNTFTRFNNPIRTKYIGAEGFEIRLAIYQKMPFYLLKSATDQTYKLYIRDGTEELLLKRISLKINKGSFKQPNYQSVDVVIAKDEGF
ncbi:MAG: DUF4833 domain-containing protein [Chitinophagaceae bacterium]|nr:MAG: DUF4833 domain-containing protein [Chitinophagaceae bacterium]